MVDLLLFISDLQPQDPRMWCKLKPMNWATSFKKMGSLSQPIQNAQAHFPQKEVRAAADSEKSGLSVFEYVNDIFFEN
jgi:hypothetical protein